MAAHLLRAGGDSIRLTLIEPRAELGRGLAYATADESHRLNVRASNMSAFADDSDHFWRWLKADGYSGEDRFCFVPRAVYGRYLAGLVEGRLTETPSAALRWLRETAVALTPRKDAAALTFANGMTETFDAVVLCCGHEPLESLKPPFVSPWEEPSAWNADPSSKVLILGTGLTMVDAALSLSRSGHHGPIVALSRRGLLPQAHRRVDAAAFPADALPSSDRLAAFLRWLRQRAREEESRGGNWRSVVDGLRPHTQAIWRSMSVSARRRFLEHARPWWDIHRHRMAPDVEESIQSLRASGQLSVLSGRLTDVEAIGAGARVLIRPRGQLSPIELRVSRIVSCRGVSSDPRRTANPLVARLLAAGLARVDPLGIGLDLDGDCALIDARGRKSRRVFAIGPMSQAAFWESIAVPDIRIQAAALAKRLIERVPLPALAGAVA